MEIHRVRPDERPRPKDILLPALQDAPDPSLTKALMWRTVGP